MKRLNSPSFSSIKRSEQCKDIIRISVVVDEHGNIADIGAEVYGCGYSIAGASLLNECALNCNIEDVEDKFIMATQSLMEDVPDSNKYCINLALKVFREIYEKYRNK